MNSHLLTWVPEKTCCSEVADTGEATGLTSILHKKETMKAVLQIQLKVTFNLQYRHKMRESESVKKC